MVIKFLLCFIIWYQAAIQPYFEISNFLLLLGLLLTFFVVVDCYSNYGFTAVPRLPGTAYALALYFIITYIVGMAVAPDVGTHIRDGAAMVEFMVLMVFTCYYAKTRKSADFLVWNYVLMNCVMLVVFLINPVEVGSAAEGVRYSYSLNTNPNTFAMSLTIGVFGILYKIMQKKIKVIIGLPVCGVFLYACSLTGSRKGFFGMVLALVLWAVICYIPLSSDKKPIAAISRFLIIAAACVVLFLVLRPLLADSTLMSRFQSLGKETGDKNRLDMYVKGLEYLKNSPLFGYGFWGFGYFYGVYSHSTWVEAFVSSGIPLGVVYAVSFLSVGISLISANNRKTAENYETLVCVRQYLVLFLVFVFYSICVIHIYNINSMICMGLMISAADLAKNSERKTNNAGNS